MNLLDYSATLKCQSSIQVGYNCEKEQKDKISGFFV